MTVSATASRLTAPGRLHGTPRWVRVFPYLWGIVAAGEIIVVHGTTPTRAAPPAVSGAKILCSTAHAPGPRQPIRDRAANLFDVVRFWRARH
jgi:hypothetical protein